MTTSGIFGCSKPPFLFDHKQYIGHHLKIAGVQNQIFTGDAMEVIHEFCGGIARKVNNVCTACLLDAYAKRENLIDGRMVKVVLENEFAV